MKKFLKVVALATFFILALMPHEAKAQYTMYSWTDSTHITTSPITITTTEPYRSLICWTDTVDVWIKWNDVQSFVLLKSGAVFKFGAYDKVSKIIVKTVAGRGVIFFAGLKTKRQTAREF